MLAPRALLLLALCGVAAASTLKAELQLGEEAISTLLEPVVNEAFVDLAMLELEEHEDTETPPFSVCKYLLETSALQVSAGDKWPEMAKKIADVRENLPEHVRSACDHFIKRHSEEITSLLELSVTTGNDDIENFVANELPPDEEEATPEDRTPQQSSMNQQDQFKQFWEEKGKYCGACLTMTKKIQKWLSLNCTQQVIGERVMRMCGQMPAELEAQCQNNEKWIVDYVVKELFLKFPLPNHCAFIGLCEKTMVIRSLQNPLVMADEQNELIQELSGKTPNLVQEDQLVLQKAHATVNTAPEITFDLGDDTNPGGAGISYRDVDKSLGDALPKMYMDGHHEATDLREDAFATSLLETESQTEAPMFDLSDPNDPHVLVHAQDEDKVHVPIMHGDIKKTTRLRVQKNYGFQENHLPIDNKWLKGCAACQFTISALFEFLSNPRTIRSMLPAVKKACKSCNNAEEVKKCEELVENHGVAFYQDIVRQGLPSKWCPRLQLCEIQYFYPSPHVLADTYSRRKEEILKVTDF